MKPKKLKRMSHIKLWHIHTSLNKSRLKWIHRGYGQIKISNKLIIISKFINRRPRSGRRLYLNPRKDLTINPKKSKKKIKKKIKIKIKIKSPLSMHHTTQLWNFFIGHWTWRSTQKNQKKNFKKNQNKITFTYAPYYTIMQLLHWTWRSTQKNQKKNQNKITFIYAPYYTIMELFHWTLDLTINPKKSKKKLKIKSN